MSGFPYIIDSKIGDVQPDDILEMAVAAGIGEGSNLEFANFVVGWLSMADRAELGKAMAGYRRLMDAREAPRVAA